MKYPIIILILIILIYPLSFAMYNWNNDNKTAAIGTVLINWLPNTSVLYFIFTLNLSY